MTELKIKRAGVEPPKTTGVSSGGAAGRPEGSDFADSVKTARKTLLDGELRKMLDQTRALGEVFLRSPDEEKLDRYKQGIKEYLERASKEAFSLRQEFGTAHGGQQKVYQLVETVNKEIDSLTQETLQKDKALALLSSLDEIRGLVLDLFS